MKFSKAFQKHILGCCCQDLGFANKYLPLLSADYFENESHAALSEYLKQFVMTRGMLPSPASLIQISNEERMVRELYAEDISDITYVQEEVVRFCRLQACKLAVKDAARMLMEESDEEAGIVPIMEKALMVGSNTDDIGESVWANGRESDYKTGSFLEPISTGQPVLDSVIGGGLSAGEVGVVMGAAKSGKSFWLLNFAFGAASALEGKKVIYYTLELSAKKTMLRLDKRIVGAESSKFLSDPETFVQQLKIRRNKLLRGDILMKYFPTRSAGVSDLKAHIQQCRAVGYHPDLIVVDYGDILKPERRRGEMRHEQAGIYEDLRSMAGSLSLPIWTGTQTNRAAPSKDTLDMDDVGESFEKIQIVDMAMGISQTQSEKLTNTGRLHVFALRDNAMNKVIRYRYDFSRSLIDCTEVLSGKELVTSREVAQRKAKGRRDEKECKAEEHAE